MTKKLQQPRLEAGTHERTLPRLAMLAFLVLVLLIPNAPATAYCLLGQAPHYKWAVSSVTPTIHSSMSSAWDTPVSQGRHQWNNIANSNWYYGVPYRSDQSNYVFRVDFIDFSAAGYPNVPGATVPTYSGTTVTKTIIHMNSDYSWNGNMVPGVSADRRTVLVHEFGHPLVLLHPGDCGSMTSDEVAAAMNPNWTTKHVTNSDDKAGIAVLY